MRAGWCFLLARWLSVKMHLARMACSDAWLFALCDGPLLLLCSLMWKEQLSQPAPQASSHPSNTPYTVVIWLGEVWQRSLPHASNHAHTYLPCTTQTVVIFPFAGFSFLWIYYSSSGPQWKFNSVKQGNFESFPVNSLKERKFPTILWDFCKSLSLVRYFSSSSFFFSW